jgi:Tfp pilus assembly protein PilO
MDETKATDAHETRVRQAFDSLDRKLSDRLDANAKESVEKLRAAAAAKDADRLRTQLNDLSRQHGWLYRELASHPEIANLLDELALLGL